MTINCGQFLQRTANVFHACKEYLWEKISSTRPAFIQNIKKFLQFYCCLCYHYYKRRKSIDDVELSNNRNQLKVNCHEIASLEITEPANTPIICLEAIDEMWVCDFRKRLPKFISLHKNCVLLSVLNMMVHGIMSWFNSAWSSLKAQ